MTQTKNPKSTKQLGLVGDRSRGEWNRFLYAVESSLPLEIFRQSLDYSDATKRDSSFGREVHLKKLKVSFIHSTYIC